MGCPVQMVRFASMVINDQFGGGAYDKSTSKHEYIHGSEERFVRAIDGFVSFLPA